MGRSSAGAVFGQEMSAETRSQVGCDDILLRAKAAAPSDNQGNGGGNAAGGPDNAEARSLGAAHPSLP